MSAAIRRNGGAVPIGTACDGEELLVLNDRLEPVSPGETGDLYIRGVGLSPGYWRDPERTAAAFMPRRNAVDSTDRLYKTGDLAKIGREDRRHPDGDGGGMIGRVAGARRHQIVHDIAVG